MEQRASNGSSILSSPLSFYASDKNSFFEEKDKKKKIERKEGRKEKRNERIKDSRKSLATIVVMTDKKETERERESGVVLSELGRFYRHAANRSLQTLEGSKKRSASIYIYIHTRDPTATKQPTSGKRPYFYVTCILRG